MIWVSITKLQRQQNICASVQIRTSQTFLVFLQIRYQFITVPRERFQKKTEQAWYIRDKRLIKKNAPISSTTKVFLLVFFFKSISSLYSVYIFYIFIYIYIHTYRIYSIYSVAHCKLFTKRKHTFTFYLSSYRATWSPFFFGTSQTNIV